MKPRNVFGSLAMAAAVLAAAAAGCAGVPRGPQVLSAVSDTFAAPYDAVWDATLRSLGVVRPIVVDKAAGRIETEVFTYTFFMTDVPTRPHGPVFLASLASQNVLLAQDGGADNKPTQVVWIAMLISVSRVADNRTQVQVEPRIHHALLGGFTPGPTNSPWVDLFAKIRSHLGTR